ncbi:hypothetical protein B5M09_003685 [Aphanomyces astaci]|uniref:Uncharacterized protein n=1 Tax=Aphanomyces astaci TaxID=112090 RepID=A0A3R7X472_APHAT|nr:hypothetical protein B5M09_003685 [Aphanomyces astaci]
MRLLAKRSYAISSIEPSLDASPSVVHVVTSTHSLIHDDDDTTEDDMTAITPRRSRSYEALVQLEAILETRHRQLMANGVLDDVRDNTSSPLVMTDIQSELYRIQHEPPLRPQRSQGDQTTPRALDLIESDGWTFDPKHEFDDFPGTKTK